MFIVKIIVNLIVYQWEVAVNHFARGSAIDVACEWHTFTGVPRTPATGVPYEPGFGSLGCWTCWGWEACRHRQVRSRLQPLRAYPHPAILRADPHDPA